MSNNNSEQVIVSAKANVMVYDDINRKWNPSGSSPGLSKVQIYQHLLNQTYRVVGRKVQDHEVVINCLLAKGLKYNQANQTFLQWRDSKQVYGLHFLSKDEADAFTQTLKMAVDNLSRLAAVSTIPNNANTIGNSMAGDNISVGKRSISSDYNPIYDENDRQCYNVVHSNGNGVSHHTNGNGNGIYNGNNSITSNTSNLRQQQQQMQQQQSVTSPPLSASSSTSSSSSNGLSIAITNAANAANSSNGTNGYHHRQNSDYNYTNGVGGGSNGTTNQIYIKQQEQQQQQQPLYQSSPIPPPPPPPPPVPIFANLNGSNPANNGNSSNYIASIHSNSSMNNMANNNSNNDNYSQKIYDVIPDSNFTSNNTIQTNSAPPPPPPPIPNGLFGNSSTSSSSSSGGPPPPPPPPINQLFNAVNANAAATATATSNAGGGPSSSYTNEIAKFQQNKLKKVDEGGSGPSGGGGRAGPQLDFLTEIRQKIEKKQQQLTGSGNGGEVDTVDAAAYKPSSAGNSSLAQRGGNKNSSSSSVVSQSQYGRGQQPTTQQNQFDSPKTIKNTPNVVNGNGTSYSNGNASTATDQSSSAAAAALNLDKLKQELVNEFRKELQTFKADIVSTILNELRKQN